MADSALFPRGLPGTGRKLSPALVAFRSVLEGRGDEPVAKAYAADDADALSADEPTPMHPAVICPTCGFMGPPVAVERHMRRRGHADFPEPECVPKENVAANPDYDDAGRKESLRKALASPDTRPLNRLGAAYELAKLEGGKRVKDKRRCTVCGAVVDDTKAGLHKHSQLTNHGSFAPYFR